MRREREREGGGRERGREGESKQGSKGACSLARSLSFSPFKYIGVSYSLAETSQMYMGC